MPCPICSLPTATCRCGSTPAQYPPGGAPAQPAPSRFVQFGGYLICPRCRYTEEFCGCDKQPPPPPPTGDGVDSSLSKRVRELRGGR